jgi:hypothetical protein
MRFVCKCREWLCFHVRREIYKQDGKKMSFSLISVVIYVKLSDGKIQGFGGVRNATTPSIISEVPYAEEVACGGYHTCVVTRGGELYTWGSNENGCLGTDSTYVSHSPVRVEGPFLESTVSQVSCGWKHTAAISDNNVFTWGWGGSHGTFSVDGHSSGGQLVCFIILSY